MQHLITRSVCLYLVVVVAIPAFAKQTPTRLPPATDGATARVSLIPAESDEYASAVRRAESGATDIDFRAMRLAYVRSAAFLRARAAADQLGTLREEMAAAMVSGEDATRVRDTARRIMRIVYIDLAAQKALRQACTALKDEACAARYHDLEFGLLRSILSSGDGKSCSTAWQVVTLEEEYFILRMRGFTLRRQQGPHGSQICDKMNGVGEDGRPLTFYFDARVIFEGYQRIGRHVVPAK